MNIINEIRLSLAVRSGVKEYFREQYKAAREELANGGNPSDDRSQAEIVRRNVENLISRANCFIEDEKYYLQNKLECDNLLKEFAKMQGQKAIPEDMRASFTDTLDKLTNLIMKYDV